MATAAPYENFIIENKIESVLTTKLSMNPFITVDNSLQQAPGMIKKVHVYNSTGQVDDVDKTDGNTHAIAPQYTEAEYTVKYTQGKFAYYDEDALTDPTYVDAGLQGLSEAMTNDITAKVVGELAKGTQVQYGCTWAVDDFIDALALYPYEDEQNLFCFISPAQRADIRKALADDLKYVEDFARTGYIGSVMGVPIYVTKACTDGEAYIATKEAVTMFTAKGLEVEQERDAEHRKSTVISRQPRVIALTDATRVIVMTEDSASE